MLAELGYVAFAIDMYGEGRVADHPKDAGIFSSSVMKNFDLSKERFNKAMSVLVSELSFALEVSDEEAIEKVEKALE